MSFTVEERYSIFWHDREVKFRCFYCGEPASTLDHQPPKSRVSDYESLRLRHETYVKVPCCEECNALLGAALTVDLIEREMLAKSRLDERYGRLVEIREWTDREIRDKGFVGGLRATVKSFKAKQEWVRRRLDYAGGINAWIDRLSGLSFEPEQMLSKLDED